MAVPTCVHVSSMCQYIQHSCVFFFISAQHKEMQVYMYVCIYIYIYIYIHHIFFIHSSIDRSLSFLFTGNCKLCRNEHGGTDIILSQHFNFLWINTQKICWLIWQFYFLFFKANPQSSITAAPVYIPIDSTQVFSFLYILSYTLFLVLLLFVILTGVR